MAIKKVCDRCGNEINDYELTLGIEILNQKRDSVFAGETKIVSAKVWNEYKKVDFCKACAKEFDTLIIEFLRKK
jgi:hypothetical protein